MYCLHEFEENENRKEIKNFTTGDLEARLYRHSRNHNQAGVDKAAIELSDLRDELVRMVKTCRSSMPILGDKNKGLPEVRAR